MVNAEVGVGWRFGDIQIGQRGWFDLGNSGPGNSSRLQSVYLKIGTWMTQKGSRLFRAICGKEESNLITSERENFTKKSQRAFGSLKKSSFGKVPTFTLDSCLWCFLYIIYIFCFFFFFAFHKLNLKAFLQHYLYLSYSAVPKIKCTNASCFVFWVFFMLQNPGCCECGNIKMQHFMKGKNYRYIGIWEGTMVVLVNC